MYGTICVVSTAYELNGRTNQKRRTRDALVAAARSIVAEGRTPTVEEVAEAASISRTTAYRYFPSQRALLAAAHPETAVESLLPDDAPDDVAARLDIVVAAYTQTILDNESQQRTMLRLSLEADPEERSQLPLRQGRVIKWLEEALAPLQPQLPRCGGASTRHRHPQRDRNRSIVMADRCRRPLPRGRHRPHALVSSRHARRHDCGPIRNQEEEAGWSTRRCAIAVSSVASSRSRPRRRSVPDEQAPDRATERR